METNRFILPTYILLVIVTMSVLTLSGRVVEASASEPLEDDTVYLPIVSNDTDSALPAGFDLEGHRGARGLKPENTLPAFETALDLGVTTLELDLHFTKDEIVVIWHDDWIAPDKCSLDTDDPNPPPDPDNPDVNQEDLRISHLTLSELKQYRCDRNPDPSRFPEQENSGTELAGENYRLLTLAELFDFVELYSASDSKDEAQRESANQVQFNIETKRKPDDPDAIGDDFNGVNPGAFEIAIVDLVEERNLVDRIVVQSFDHRSLWATHTLNNVLRLATLTYNQPPDVAEYVANGAVIWSPHYNDVTPARLQSVHNAGLLVIPWTVDDLDTAQMLIDLGVDGLITDRPDLFLE